ncbi:hypothetical protein [Yoonia sp. TsM2_T14_4]|uniref:hypothetical protein n=1 Tax=Yoonia sp. TsM2_T14_4 TaxID=3415141 RepID=UPI003C778060
MYGKQARGGKNLRQLRLHTQQTRKITLILKTRFVKSVVDHPLITQRFGVFGVVPVNRFLPFGVQWHWVKFGSSPRRERCFICCRTQPSSTAIWRGASYFRHDPDDTRSWSQDVALRDHICTAETLQLGVVSLHLSRIQRVQRPSNATRRFGCGDPTRAKFKRKKIPHGVSPAA